jgi:hypothetical protein
MGVSFPPEDESPKINIWTLPEVTDADQFKAGVEYLIARPEILFDWKLRELEELAARMLERGSNEFALHVINRANELLEAADQKPWNYQELCLGLLCKRAVARHNLNDVSGLVDAIKFAEHHARFTRYRSDAGRG